MVCVSHESLVTDDPLPDSAEDDDDGRDACADSRAHLKHSIGVGVNRQDLLLGFLRQNRFLFLFNRLHSLQLLMPVVFCFVLFHREEKDKSKG